MNKKLSYLGGKFYFIGIGGVSMSALAEYLYTNGFSVEGSDIVRSPQTERLIRLGVPVIIGHSPERALFSDVAVYTDAVKSDDPELSAARQNGVTTLSRAELLNLVCGGFAERVAVAGSHGKTTVTAMCAHILYAAERKFTAFIGGQDKTFSNYRSTGVDVFLTEACEYRKNILKLENLTVAVWLNCDPDHMECYRDFSDLQTTFLRYAERAQISLVNGMDEGIVKPKNALTFGVGDGFDYAAKGVTQSGERYAFTLYERGKVLCRIRLKPSGYFHIFNALAAAGAMRAIGLDKEAIRRGIEGFTGVKRRFEVVGTFSGAEVISDYAHHPKEIEKTLILAEKKCDGRVFTVFQPHTYSRTKLLMDGFVEVLSGAENVVIFKTFPAREEYDEEGCAYALHTHIKKSLYVENVRDLKSYLAANVKPRDTVLLLGAGDLAEKFFS